MAASSGPYDPANVQKLPGTRRLHILQEMAHRLWIPLLMLYILLDFCTPVIDGFMSFNVDNCVDCTQVERLDSERPTGVDRIQPGPVPITPSDQAPRPGPSPTTAGAAARPRFLIRSAHAASVAPPDSAEDH